MTISMYQASVPPFIRALNNLAAILEKGAAHAQARKIDEAVLLNSRLFPDMFPLVRQVQIATDTARSGAGRLASVDFPAYEDKEATFQDLVQRIRNTVTYLESLKPAQIDGGEEKTISWQTPQQQQEHARAALSNESPAAQHPFPCHHGVRDPAAQRSGAREEGLSGTVLIRRGRRATDGDGSDPPRAVSTAAPSPSPLARARSRVVRQSAGRRAAVQRTVRRRRSTRYR